MCWNFVINGLCVMIRNIYINTTRYEMVREVKLILTNVHNVQTNKKNGRDHMPY